MPWIHAHIASGRKWLRALLAMQEPRAAYQAKLISLGIIACGLCLCLRLLFFSSEVFLDCDGMDFVPWQWVPEWDVTVALIGGLAWLLTRDFLFEPVIDPRRRRPVLPAVLMGAFVGAMWFSFLALQAALPAVTPVSMCFMFRPLYRESNLCSTAVVSAIAGTFFYSMLRQAHRLATRPSAGNSSA